MKTVSLLILVGVSICLNSAHAERALTCGEKYFLDFMDPQIRPIIALNSIPFMIGPNGQLAALQGDEERIVSKETNGNVQKIVYKQNLAEQRPGQKNYTVRTVEQTVLITRDGDKVVGIKKIHSDKSAIEALYSGECEMEQRIVHTADPGQQDPNVVYDKKLCAQVQSASNGISMKNLKVCGEYIAKIEKAFNDRLQDLGKEKKSLLGTKAGPEGNLNSNASLFKIMSSCALGLGVSSGGYLEFPQPQMPQKKPKDPRYYTPKAI